jgi:hypothetical protein
MVIRFSLFSKVLRRGVRFGDLCVRVLASFRSPDPPPFQPQYKMNSSTDTGQPDTSDHLLRILGMGFGLAIVIGGTVGVGILRSPGPIAEQLGSFGSSWLPGRYSALHPKIRRQAAFYTIDGGSIAA